MNNKTSCCYHHRYNRHHYHRHPCHRHHLHLSRHRDDDYDDDDDYAGNCVLVCFLLTDIEVFD